MLPAVRETTSSRSGSGIQSPSSSPSATGSIVISAPVRSAVTCSRCARRVNADELTRTPGAACQSTSTPEAFAREISCAIPVFSVVPDGGHARSDDGCQGQRSMPSSVWDEGGPRTRGRRLYPRGSCESTTGVDIACLEGVVSTVALIGSSMPSYGGRLEVFGVIPADSGAGRAEPDGWAHLTPCRQGI